MAVKKDAAFYRKQRLDDKAKAAKGDKKAQAELSAIEKKRQATNKSKPAAAKKSSSSSKDTSVKPDGKGNDNAKSLYNAVSGAAKSFMNPSPNNGKKKS